MFMWAGSTIVFVPVIEKGRCTGAICLLTVRPKLGGPISVYQRKIVLLLMRANRIALGNGAVLAMRLPVLLLSIKPQRIQYRQYRPRPNFILQGWWQSQFAIELGSQYGLGIWKGKPTRRGCQTTWPIEPRNLAMVAIHHNSCRLCYRVKLQHWTGATGEKTINN